jgi:hypothetical protein
VLRVDGIQLTRRTGRRKEGRVKEACEAFKRAGKCGRTDSEIIVGIGSCRIRVRVATVLGEILGGTLA